LSLTPELGKRERFANTLSQEEKEEQKHIEVNKRLKGLLQKYQDNLLKKEHLEKELDSLRKAYDLKVDKMLS
jgi:cell shape-determining protein MreC